MRLLAAFALGCTACVGTAQVASTRANSAPAREHLTAAEFDAMFRRVSNWGRWGKNDQRGTLNLITPASRKAAAAEVRSGVVVSLARDLNKEKSVDNPAPFQDVLTLGADEKFNVDTYSVGFHGFGFSHFDALSHTFYAGKLYNGFPESRITAAGASVLDTTQYRDGIFTRGVLVDMPALRGEKYLTRTEVISARDLDAWEAKTRVHIGSGDAVVIRTGRWALRDASGPWDISTSAAGLDPSVVEWLRKRDVAVLVSDAAHDALPSAVDGVDYPIHVLAIVAMGMSLVDQCDLEGVAQEASRLNRHTFLLTFAPIRSVGGTGALINPTALF